MLVSLYVNNKKEYWDVAPDDCLADSLRSNGYKSVKTGCYEGACGACTVFIDDKPMLSCEVLTVRMEDRYVTTIEGIDEEAKKVAQSMLNHGAVACGYCAPGFIMQVIAMKRGLDKPTREQVRQYLNGNLCRCTGYKSRNSAAEDYLKME